MFNQKSMASYSRNMSVYLMLFVCVFMSLSSVTTYASHCGALAKEANDALADWSKATTAFALASSTASVACEFASIAPTPQATAACYFARAAQTLAGIWLADASLDYYNAGKAYLACMNEHSGSENN